MAGWDGHLNVIIMMIIIIINLTIISHGLILQLTLGIVDSDYIHSRLLSRRYILYILQVKNDIF